MGSYEIHVGGAVHGVVGENNGQVFVTAVLEDRVRSAVAELLHAAGTDPDLPPERGAEIRGNARELLREVLEPGQRPEPEALRRRLSRMAAAAGTAVVTAGAVEAVRNAVGALA
jgi:hypothetical protein